MTRSRQLSSLSGAQPRAPASERGIASDGELLESGAPEAFALFYRRHVRDLLGHLVRLTGDPDVAADLMAETFATALSPRVPFDPARGSAKAWLYGIAHNKLADYRRRGRAELRAMRRLGMERVELTAEDRYEIEYLGGICTAELIEELPSAQRAVLKARLIDERSYEDIGRELSVSEESVRKRVSRGLATLRRRMGVVR